jgi:mRNA interferase MazF
LGGINEYGELILNIANLVGRQLHVEHLQKSLLPGKERAMARKAAKTFYKTGNRGMKRGHLYLVRLDPTEGSEQGGTRPAVIISRDTINLYSPVLIICPMTSAAKVKRLYPSDVLIQAPEGGLAVNSVIMTLQVRVVAKSRLAKRLGQLTTQSHNALKITLDL